MQLFGSKTKGNKKRINTARLSSLHRRNKKKDEKSRHGILIHIHKATNLPSADSNGFSDPYVRFKINNRKVGRSSTIQKTLNPVWDEEFFTKISDFKQTLKLEVWDWDRGSLNDYLEEVEIDLSKYFNNRQISATNLNENEIEKSVEFELDLYNRKTKEAAGEIFFSVSKCRNMPKRKAPKWTLKQSDAVAKQLIVDLVSAKDLAVMDRNGKSDPYCILNFQGKKSRSRTVRFTTSPTWKQRFDFAFNKNADAVDSDDGALTSYKAAWEPEWAQERMLEIQVYDYNSMLGRKDDMGVAKVDVSELADQNGGANEVWAQVYLNGQPAGVLLLYISIMDVTDQHKLSTRQQQSYPAALRVNVIQANKPKAGGKKKVCYVEVQVGKNKLRTQPVEDCKEPHFERYLEIPVRDIFASVEITLVEKRYDAWEEKPTLVGKLEMPIFSFFNAKDTKPTWHILKDEELQEAVNAQVRFSAQLNYSYSPFTLLQLIKRHETNPLTLRQPTTVNNMRHQVARVSYYFKEFQGGIKKVFGLLKWDYGFYHSVVAMVSWFLFCMFYRPWFLPLIALSILIYHRMNPEHYYGDPLVVNESGEVLEHSGADFTKIDRALEEYEGEQDEFHDNDDNGGIIGLGIGVAHTFSNYNLREAVQDAAPVMIGGKKDDKRASVKENFKSKKPKTTLAERIAMPIKIFRTVQNTTESMADYYERIIGIVIWRNPDITKIIAVGLFLATIVLMFVPLYVILIVAVEWQFIKRGLRKYGFAFQQARHRVPYQPVLHFLQKVHTHDQKKRFAKVKIEEDLANMLEESNIYERMSSIETRYVKS